MKIKKIIQKVGIALMCCSLLVSCVNDVDLSNVSSDISLMDHLVIPLGKTSVKTSDLLKDFDSEYLKENSQENYYFLQFSNNGSFDFRNIDLFPGVPQQVVTTHRIADHAILPISKATGLSPEVVESAFDVMGKITIPNQIAVKDIIFTDTIHLGLNANTNDMRLDSLLLSRLRYQLSLDVTGISGIKSADVKLTIDPKFIKNVPEYSFTLLLDDTPSVIDLSDVMLLLSDPENNKGIPYKITLTLNTNNSLTINKNAEIELKHNVSNLDFEVLYGAISPTYNYSYEDEIDIDIPDDFAKNASLKLFNPQFFLTLHNGIGMELDFKVNYLKAYTQGKEADAIFADFCNSGGCKSKIISINARPERYGDKPATQTPAIVFNRENSGTNLFFAKDGFVPNKLKYSFSVAKSASPIAPKLPDFLSKNSKIAYDMNIVIPLQLDKESCFVHTDTIYDIGLNGENELVADSISLYLHIENGLPVTAYLNLVLLDENGEEIPSQLSREDLIDPIYAGKVDDKGKVTEPTNLRYLISMTKKEFDDLKKTKDLVLKFKVDGKDKNGNYQRIFLSPDDALKVQIAAAINGGTISEKMLKN